MSSRVVQTGEEREEGRHFRGVGEPGLHLLEEGEVDEVLSENAAERDDEDEAKVGIPNQRPHGRPGVLLGTRLLRALFAWDHGQYAP
jgi:hypothetical protein